MMKPTALALALVATPAFAEPDAAAFDACLDRLAAKSAERGVSRETFERHTRDVVPDASVLEALDAQPEFVTPIWDYLAGLVDDERVEDGRAMLREHADVLAEVERQYGVDPETVVAVWGVESDYGNVFGKRPLVTSLATLSCFGRRQDFFRGELFAALRILQAGDIEPAAMTGSWAGAFGHTQFMPSTFERIAVDFDGDGRRDLVGSVADALASTANYLEQSGWRSGQPWGFEANVPQDFDASLAGRRSKRAVSAWSDLGVTRMDGAPLAGDGIPADRHAAVLLPAGKDGPAFVVFRNYDAIYSYNAAESYALAIALLSDRLRGGDGLVARWPTDDPGLSRAQRRALQAALIARGHDIGEVDGMIGSRTRQAIAQEQRRLGWTVDGRAGQRILRALSADE